jgi:hypothetical protein
MKETSVLEVEQGSDGVKRWIVKRYDKEPDIVGKPTVCGVPYKALLCPAGSRFTCVFETPPTPDSEDTRDG